METTGKKTIDLAYLTKLSNGSNEFMNEMISIFMVQTPEELDNLEKHLMNKDWKALRATAHKMKPSFSFMGIQELESVIKAVESNAANETNLEQLPALIDRLKSTSTEAIKELAIEIKKFS